MILTIYEEALKEIANQQHAEDCRTPFCPLPECGCQPSPRCIAQKALLRAEEV